MPPGGVRATGKRVPLSGSRTVSGAAGWPAAPAPAARSAAPATARTRLRRRRLAHGSRAPPPAPPALRLSAPLTDPRRAATRRSARAPADGRRVAARSSPPSPLSGAGPSRQRPPGTADESPRGHLPRPRSAAAGPSRPTAPRHGRRRGRQSRGHLLSVPPSPLGGGVSVPPTAPGTGGGAVSISGYSQECSRPGMPRAVTGRDVLRPVARNRQQNASRPAKARRCETRGGAFSRRPAAGAAPSPHPALPFSRPSRRRRDR